jgi:hypothetical protein
MFEWLRNIIRKWLDVDCGRHNIYENGFFEPGYDPNAHCKCDRCALVLLATVEQQIADSQWYAIEQLEITKSNKRLNRKPPLDQRIAAVFEDKQLEALKEIEALTKIVGDTGGEIV